MIILSSLLDGRPSFLGVSHWMFISVFWWSHVCLLFQGLCSLPCIGVCAVEGASLGRFLGRQVGPSLCLERDPALNHRPLPGGRACLRVPEWAELFPSAAAQRPSLFPSVRLRGQGPAGVLARPLLPAAERAWGQLTGLLQDLQPPEGDWLAVGAVGVSPGRPLPHKLGGPGLSYKDGFRVFFWVRVGGPPSRDAVSKSPGGSLGSGPAAGSQSSHPGASVHGGLRDCCC